MAQNFYKFKAASLEEAYRAMRKRLGPEALVVRTATLAEGGVLGFFTKKVIEVTASAHAQSPRKPTALERKYQASSPEAQVPTTTQERDVGKEDAGRVALYESLIRDAQVRMNQSGVVRPKPPVGTTRTEGSAVPSPIVPFPGKDASEERHERNRLREDVNDMRDMLQVLFTEMPGAGLPEEMAPMYRTLLDRGVTRTAAAALVTSAAKCDEPSLLGDGKVLRERLKMEVRRNVHVTGGLSVQSGRRKVVALVGATGVGKTTNVAKLAAHFAVRERARVALITSDTYRVAAAEQLRVYANIIGLEMRVVNDAKEMTAALALFREYDLVFMDTAGGSPYNDEQMDDVHKLLEAAQPTEVMLLLGAGTPLEDLRDTVTRFSRLSPTSLFFTKLDETRRYGPLYCLSAESGLPLSYFSVGQNVPDDVKLAQAGVVAELIIEGGYQGG